MTHPILALWAVPRSVSTAVERMMAARGDLAIVNEPFSGHYYHGPERRNTRYPAETPGPEHDPQHVRDGLIEKAAASPVFFKDMAYHITSCVNADFLKPFRSALLIRDPRFSIPSLYRQIEDFTLEETGFAELHRLAGYLHELSGEPPIVIDGETLRSDPESIYRQYCEAVGIPFRPESLSWSSGEEQHWSRWNDWYKEAASSTGIRPPAAKPDAKILSIPRVAEAVAHCQPYYDELARLAIRPRDEGKAFPEESREP